MDTLRQWFDQEFDRLVSAAGATLARETSIIGSKEEERAYLAFHRGRFSAVLSALKEAAGERSLRVLDIGTSHLTLLLKGRYDAVTTIDGQPGWRTRVVPQGIQFIVHDLSRSSLPFSPGSFDVIVCSEVIEHLPYAPARLLAQCARALTDGGILVLTTPNACSYYHRRDMLCGRNPFLLPPPGDDPTGSSHRREYTMAELREACSVAGFHIMRATYPWYWNQPARHGAVSRLKGALLHGFLTLWPSLRDAMLIVARRGSE